VTMTPALVETCVRLAREHAKGDFEVRIWANACDRDFDLQNIGIVSSYTNAGVVGPMDRLWRETDAEIVAFVHDDLEIYEDGWDLRIRARFAASPDCGLVGFGGACSIGREDMYTCGSEAEPTRGPFGSNLTSYRKEMTAAEVHGPRITYDCQVATIDGFAAVCRRTFLEKIDGFVKWPIVHHAYDAFLACMAKRHGFETWIVPIKMGHPWIGGTSQREDGLELLAKHGGNYGLFLKAQGMLREEFRDVLPFALPGVKHVYVDTAHIQPVYDNYFGAVTVSALALNPAAVFAIDILKRMLDGSIVEDPNTLPLRPEGYDPALRANGKDWPATAHTMVGRRRLDNFQACIEGALAADVPGDIVETGVWRGGASILARGVLKAHGILGRQVWVCDSFEGLPKPEVAQDAGDAHHTNPFLAVSLDEVKKNFDRYGLLDDQVTFVKGWFKDTLHNMNVQRISVLRLDGDMYQSTMDALTALYPKVSKGGYVIIDDYHELAACKKAVADYRAQHGISEPIIEIDGSGVFWRREKIWWTPIVKMPITLVIPTLTKEGASRTQRLVDVAMSGTRPPDKVFVIDNGGHFTKTLDGIEVFTPGKNIGVGAAWNEGLKRFPDWIIFANDDAEIEADTIEKFARAAETSDKGLITCDIGHGFPFFLLKQSLVRAIGNFDERFFAYFEDTDFLHRMKLAGQTQAKVGGAVRHSVSGGTSSREAKLTGVYEASAEAYAAKWGGPPGKERGPAQAVPGRKPAPGVNKDAWRWRRAGEKRR
jgi:O-methyltransferase